MCLHPIYKRGGWIAKAGSCKIGLRPSPSKGFGEIILKGLEPKNKNSEKNSIIKFWNIIVKRIYFLLDFKLKTKNR